MLCSCARDRPSSSCPLMPHFLRVYRLGGVPRFLRVLRFDFVCLHNQRNPPPLNTVAITMLLANPLPPQVFTGMKAEWRLCWNALMDSALAFCDRNAHFYGFRSLDFLQPRRVRMCGATSKLSCGAMSISFRGSTSPMCCRAHASRALPWWARPLWVCICRGTVRIFLCVCLRLVHLDGWGRLSVRLMRNPRVTRTCFSPGGGAMYGL